MVKQFVDLRTREGVTLYVTMLRGVDVSKALDVYVRPSGDSFFHVSHDDAGFVTLIARMRPLTPTIVVLEATGGYEVTVAITLTGARLPVAVVNPRQIRDFARATGQLAKTVGPTTVPSCASRGLRRGLVRERGSTGIRVPLVHPSITAIVGPCARRRLRICTATPSTGSERDGPERF
jgi:transposase